MKLFYDIDFKQRDFLRERNRTGFKTHTHPLIMIDISTFNS